MDAVDSRQGSAWQLLLQFVPADGPAGEYRAAQRITEAVRDLGLQPAEVDRIGKAVMEALRKATQREMRDPQNPTVSIRVWVSDLSTANPLRPTSDVRRIRSQKGSGWGFFLLERQESDLQDTQIESHRVFELYLYQEPARMK